MLKNLFLKIGVNKSMCYLSTVDWKVTIPRCEMFISIFFIAWQQQDQNSGT